MVDGADSGRKWVGGDDGGDRRWWLMVAAMVRGRVVSDERWWLEVVVSYDDGCRMWMVGGAGNGREWVDGDDGGDQRWWLMVAAMVGGRVISDERWWLEMRGGGRWVVGGSDCHR
uniref:Uncharacterized protein LOC105851570 n=1 Tax=Cicer arietinum TaxID=3827 RepID=A0A1S3DXH8_CICAR|nr:uncharacterized protein LOC105851570 [Cicer arietinum]